MSEKPILFSAPMVRAILEGRKTQTRRIVKPHRSWECHSVCAPEKAADPWAVWFHYPETDRVGHLMECPYGKPADRLWVKETFTSVGKKNTLPLWYRADAPAGERVRVDAPWRPAIFMSRAFSRITLEITEVRVQRLQEISREDALAEGVEYWTNGHATPMSAFHELWESINGKGSWDANPWVWALSFRRIEAAERAA